MFRSIRAKFTFWYIGSFFVLLILSFGATELFFELFALKTVDNALYNGAKRLEQALLVCFPFERELQQEVLNECLDKHIRKLFVHDIVYAQMLQWPENQETTPE